MNISLRCSASAGAGLFALLLSATSYAQPAERTDSYDRIADEATAAALKLTDEQKTSVATVISERDAALAAAENDEAKAGVTADAQEKLAAVLSEEQQTQFSALFDTPRIKFNFRFQKWAEVLPWVAGEAGLSLVMETAPEGFFNYIDRREYKPDEAIDLLNGWLMIKGFTLIRRDQLLMCISLKDGIPDGTVPRVSLDELPNRGRFEFVSVLIPLEARDAAVVMAEIEPLVSAWGEAKPLPATKQLLVTDAADIVRSIQQVALAVPPPKAAPKPPAPAPAPKPVLTTYPVQHANPAAVVELLKKFMSGTILLDETASQITINAVPAQHALAVKLMKQLEENQGPNRRPDLKTYPVDTDSPDQMITSLKLAVPTATLRYDSVARRLVVFATQADHDKLVATLRELENQATVSEDQLSVHPLKDIDPEVIQQLITSVLPDVRVTIDSRTSTLIAVGRLAELRAVKTLVDQLQPKVANISAPVLHSYPVPPEVSEIANTVISSVVPNATVTPDAANRRLLIVAQPKDHETIAATLDKLAQDVAANGLTLKSYDARGISYSSVSPLLQTLVPDANLIDESANQRLLAIADAEDHEKISNVLEQIRDDPDANRLQLRFYPLPDEMNQQQVTTLMSSFGVEASITFDDTNNRLMVTASADDHQKFTELLEQLTPEMPAEKPQLKSYSLPEQVDNETFTSMLTSVAKNAMVRMDAVNKRLLITATAEDHAAVAQLLEQLTSGLPDSEKQLRFYPLPDEFNEQQVTTLMSSFGLEASVTVDDTNNRLMVTASADDHQKFTELLEQLTPEMPAEKPQLKSYSLPEQVDNETFTSMLTSVAKNAMVRMDAVNKRLLITATAEDHAAVAQLLEQLTSGLPDSEKQLRFYPLPDEFNEQQVTTLMSSFGLEASVTVDDANNRLMVTASANDHRKFTELLEQLTPEMPAEKSQLKSYSLPEQIDNETFTSMLSAVAKQATVRIDAVNNRLLITATADDHAAAAQLLEQLTSDLPDANKRLQAYPLPQQISSETVSSMLLALAPGATVTVDSTNEHLLVTATDELQQTVAAALDQLTTGLSPKRPKLKTFLLPANVTADTIMALLTPIAPKATVTVDPAGKRILVTATDEDLALIGPMLMQLVDGQDQNQRELRSYPLKADVDPATVTTLLNSLTPEAAVTADPAGHRLLVTATSRDHASIDSAIAQITRDARGELPQLQYYPLGRVNGEYAVGILSSIVSGVTIKHEPESKRLSVIASESDHRILQETLVKLESAAPEQEARTLRVYGVTKSQQARFSTVLQGLTEEMPELQVLTGGEPDEMIIWAKPSQHTIVDTVLAQLDRDIPADQKPSLVVYPISKVEAESVAEVLREIFPDATINVDSRASRLLVRARPAMQKTIKSAIRQLDEEIPDGREIKLMVYPVKGLNVETILSLINQEVPQVTVIRDDTAETFIIRGQLEDHQKVAELLETLRASEVGKQIPAVYPLSQGDPNRVREFFERAFPGAMAVVDPDARTLTILATTEDQEQIRKFIEDLRRADAEHPHTSELKVYSVRGASSTELRLIISESVPRARLVIANDQLMAWAQADDQALIQGIVDGLRDASGKLTVTAFDVSRIDVDTATSVLSTVAPGTQFMIGRNGRALIATVDENTKANVEAALAQLEKSPAARQEQTLRFYTVDRSTAPSVQNVLNAAVPEVSLLLSSDGTQLFARVTSDQHAKIAETLAQIAEANPFESIRVLRMYSIAKSGTNTSTVLQRMVPSAVVNVGSQPAQLMIEATESDHAQIEQLISQLEHAAGDSDRELKFYDVDPATIGNIRTTLTSVVPEVTLTTSTDNTRLIAHVTSAQHERIMETLQQLDVEQPFSSNRTLKVYSTTDSGANTSSVLQRMVPAAVVNSGGKPDQLLVEATERDHQRIVQLITQLEEASDDTERQLKFYDVNPATVSSTQSALTSIVPEVTFTVSTDSTRLIAHVTDEQHEKIAQTLEQLSAEQPFRSNRVLKFYSVAKAGSDASSVLQRLVPSAVITSGTQSGQLMVEATPAQHEEIARLLTQITAAAAHDSLKVRFYAVDQRNLENIRSVVTAAVPDVSFRASADGTQLIAVVSDDQHAKIIEAVQALAQEQPFQSNRMLKFYSSAGAGIDALTVLQRMVPSALINNGAQADQLMVEATAAQHGELAELLASLKEAAQDDARSLKFYEVNRAQLSNAQELVTDAVPGLNIKVSADGTRLIALATAEQHEKIDATLEQLATAGAPRKTTSVFDITGTDPDAMRTALEPFTAGDDHVRITVDATSRRVYVHAFEDRQVDIREAITQIMAGVEEGADTQVATYFVGDGNGDEAEEALSAMYPAATIVSDRSQRLIIATATPEQHETIKVVAEQMQNAVSLRNDVIPRTYDTTHLDASYLESVLENLFPRDRDFIVSVNSETGQVVALAKETQHETIKALLLEIDREPATTAKTVRVYRTAPMTPTTVMATLEPLVSRHTTISAERSGEEIVVSAPAAEQTKIADLLQQMGISPEDVEKNLALYRVAPLDPRTVVSALEPLVSKHVKLSAERSGQEIVVSAPPEEQEKIATLVQQMRSHRTQLEGVQIRSYRVGRGQARDAISVLSPMFPDATLVTDRRLETVVATARPEEHETIAEVVKQMAGRGDEANLPTPKSYLLRQYDGNKMIEMLEATFTAADDVRVTWDDRNKRIIAIARPNQHEIISGIIRELDPHDGPYTRHLRFYHLPNLDLGTVNRVISGAIRNLDPGGSVAVDQNGETLMVTTHDRGHLLVKDALTRFRPSQPKRLRIYQLSFMDPWEARGAIDQMIIGRIPQHHLRPDVHPDDNLQQLWVRGTDNQLKEIEQLLVQLGEVGLTSGGGAGTDANLRVVPIGNDVEGAVHRIQDLWPRIRTNPIRVLEPNQESNEEQEPVPGQFSVPPEDVGELPTQRGPRMDAKKVNEQVRAADPNGLLGASIVPEPAVDDATGAASPEPIRFDGTDPVIVIPGNGRITIASDDTDALNQLESLLRTIYSQGSSGIENRDFSVRRLRNTAAADVAATIQQILDEAERITYFGDVAVVPEERLNALIVYGNRTDRRRLDPLLEILDSEKLDSTRAYQTKLLPLKYASAARIEDVLQSIYRVQMTAGGRRSTMGIPSGVPSEVATVLRQINAAASAPLLIIETQRETNSLIIKAPPDLLNEVAELALKLDEATFTRRANGVTLLPLKKSSSKRVMEILNNVLN